MTICRRLPRPPNDQSTVEKLGACVRVDSWRRRDRTPKYLRTKSETYDGAVSRPQYLKSEIFISSRFKLSK